MSYPWKVVRRIFAGAVLLGFAILNACDGEDRAMYDPSSNHQTLMLPRALTQAHHIPSEALVGELSIDNSITGPVQLLPGGMARVSLQSLNPGPHELSLTIYYQAGAGRRIPLATLTRQLDLDDTQGSLYYTRTQVEYTQGPDGDDIPNLVEIDQAELDVDGDNLWNHEDTDSNNDGQSDNRQPESDRYRLMGNQNLITLEDDQYEPNQSAREATDLSSFQKQTLIGLVHGNEDWYRVSVPAEQTHLFVQIGFDKRQNNLDLAIYNDRNLKVAQSISATDVEMIDLKLASQRSSNYFIKVFSPNDYPANSYSLQWYGHRGDEQIADVEDDVYEDNDRMRDATDLLSSSKSVIDGFVHKDDDWFKVAVKPGHRRLQVVLSADTRGLPLSLSLYDQYGHKLQQTLAMTSARKSLELQVPEVPAEYFVRVDAVEPTYAVYSLYWRSK